MSDSVERRLCISLHDVAPATLGDCVQTLGFLDDLRLGPVALLVVPDYHGRGRADRDPRFAAFIESRLLRGDEIVLHGYSHRDTAPLEPGPRDWLERRVYTAGEGEFSRLDAATARTRLLRGLAVLRAAGWQPSGFVAPAWLMSAGTLQALEALPLEYCATRDGVILLHGGERIAAPSLVVSARSWWRRALSPLWNGAVLERHAHDPLVRAALHPQDVRYRALARLWRRVLLQMSDRRRLVTEGSLVPKATRGPSRDHDSSSRNAASLSATKRRAWRS